MFGSIDKAQFVFGYLFVTSCVCLVSMLGGVWRLRRCDGEEIFDARPAMRLAVAMIGVFMAYSVPIFWALLGYSPGTLNRFCGYAVLGLTILVTALLFWFSGPLQLRLYLHRRTYRFKRGWLWQWTFGGPLEDIAAVHVRPSILWDWREADAVFAGHDNGGGVTVWLEWRHPRRSRQILVSFRFRRLGQAKAFAERLGLALSIPIVEDRAPSAAGRRIW